MSEQLPSETPTAADDGTASEPAAENAAAIHIDGLTKRFDTAEGVETVFSDIDLEIEPGSFVVLIGKSGSGKSTLLDIVSGVLEASAGEVRFERAGSDGGDDVELGHVFQSPRLLPWNTAVENIEFVHEDDPDYTDALATEYLDLVGLSDQYEKYPGQLSGGQRQRVGIARALSIDPEVILMDEPFSNLDEITAESLRRELLSVWRRLGRTVLFVTHDITEAVQLADRVLMLGDGDIYADLDVDLPRPREVDSEAFIRFRQQAVDTFHSIDAPTGGAGNGTGPEERDGG
ncbi:MAG: ABC transporter ATP-binding protein [Halolamina sp.]